MNVDLRRFLHNHGDIATEENPKLGLCPTLIKRPQGFFIGHRTMDSTVHPRPFNSLEHCICTDQTNIRDTAGLR